MRECQRASYTTEVPSLQSRLNGLNILCIIHILNLKVSVQIFLSYHIILSFRKLSSYSFYTPLLRPFTLCIFCSIFAPFILFICRSVLCSLNNTQQYPIECIVHCNKCREDKVQKWDGPIVCQKKQKRSRKYNRAWKTVGAPAFILTASGKDRRRAKRVFPAALPDE